MVYFGRAIIFLGFCKKAFFEKSRSRKIAIYRLFRGQYKVFLVSMDLELPSVSFFDRRVNLSKNGALGVRIFEKMGDKLQKTKKNDFIFWRFFKIVIWIPMLKFCSLEDNRITYSESIGSLGLCYTDTEIFERKVTPWPCNNFAGQCIPWIYWYQ